MAQHDVAVDGYQGVSKPGLVSEVPMAELEIGAQIARIKSASSAAMQTRIHALRNVAARADATARELEERHMMLVARRQADGSIKLLADFGEVWQMGEAAAAALRDQLDVALHVPASDRPVDAPSAL